MCVCVCARACMWACACMHVCVCVYAVKTYTLGENTDLGPITVAMH